MSPSRRQFLRAAAALLPLASSGPGQNRPGMIVRSRRPEDLEMPLEGFSAWITPVERFFVRSHDYVPQVDGGKWELKVEGEVSTPISLKLRDVTSLPATELVGVLECAGNGRTFYQPHVPGAQWRYGGVGNARWKGVRLAEVLRRAGIKPGAGFVLFDGADVPPGTMPKFQRGIPLAKAMDQNTLLAYEMNGQPLTAAHGFPLRAIVPGWAGDSWAKWLTRIQVLEKESGGFFMATAYRHPVVPIAPGSAVDAREMEPVMTLRVKSVIASPPDGFWLAPAPFRVHGAAWSGTSPVTGVEVSTDSGRTWTPAALGRDQAPFAWRLWEFPWTPPHPGYYTLMARAADATGERQPLVEDWNPGGYLWNVVPQVGVTVSSAPPRPSVAEPASVSPPTAKVKSACLVCHDADVLQQQRLTRAQWEKELDKMHAWGAQFTPADRQEILRYVLQFGQKEF